jgi:hypothetical protein
MYGTSCADARYKSRNPFRNEELPCFFGEISESHAARPFLAIHTRPARIYTGITNLHVRSMTRPDSRCQHHSACLACRLHASRKAPSGLQEPGIAEAGVSLATMKGIARLPELQND